MLKYLKGDVGSYISKDVPECSYDIPDDKKIEIVINLMNNFRAQINEWNDRAFKTTTWSAGLTISFVAYRLLNIDKIGPQENTFILISVIIFGFLNILYILSAIRSHYGNGKGLVKCEALLKLCDIGEYIKDERFFGYSGKWLPSINLRILIFVHIFINIMAICSIFFITNG